MRKVSYQQLLEDLATIAAPEETKRQFEELIRRSALLDGVTSLGRPERVKYARHLLEIREPRSVISRRLMARYKIGRTQSYQVISDALQLSGFQPENRTQTASNVGITSE